MSEVVSSVVIRYSLRLRNVCVQRCRMPFLPADPAFPHGIESPFGAFPEGVGGKIADYLPEEFFFGECEFLFELLVMEIEDSTSVLDSWVVGDEPGFGFFVVLVCMSFPFDE